MLSPIKVIIIPLFFTSITLTLNLLELVPSVKPAGTGCF
jgi:hypothetical protein